MSNRRTVIIFASALIIFAFGSSIRNAIFNNYLVDIFDFTAQQRGWLEVPRELPGLLVTLSIGIFFFMKEVNLLGVSCLSAAIGMFGMGLSGNSAPSMVWWLFVWSMGTHIQLVLIERVSLDIGLAKGTGHSLGRMNGLRSIGMITGSLFVMLYPFLFEFRYDRLFFIGGATMLIGGAAYFTLKDSARLRTRKRQMFALKRRYNRYYLLAALFGVRKQIFITFAPWFLVKVLELRPEHIARILMISASLGIIVKPWLGKLIDRLGERKILIADGLIIATFCLAYTIFPMLVSGLPLIIICSACFIMDDLLFSLRTARTTWLVKIAEKPEDVTGAMSASVSIDHLLSMTISLIAGYAWITFGFEVVFLFCTLVAIAMSIVSAGIRVPAASQS
ncbi:MFS transporter [bacterium]|nr:MFS transporter [candidate division CSSED10-310 bacterium]